MDHKFSVEELNKAVEYRKIKKTIVPLAYVNILFGVINSVMGVIWMADSFLNIILVAIGVTLFTCGIWMLKKPTPGKMIVNGVTFILLAVWNLFVGILNSMAGETSPRTFIYALVQIGLVYYSFKTYYEFKKIYAARPPAEITDYLESTVDRICKAELKTEPRICLMKTNSVMKLNTDVTASMAKGAGSQYQIWKMELLPNSATLVNSHKDGHEVLFPTKNEMDIEDKGKVMIGSSRKIQLKVFDKTYTGTMTPENMEKYESWKLPIRPQSE